MKVVVDTKDMKARLREAEKKVRKQEYAAAAYIREKMPDLRLIEAEEQKAREAGFTIVRLRGKSTVPFSQVIQENLQILLRKKYLTTAEQGFLFRLLPFVEIRTNALVLRQVLKEEEDSVEYMRIFPVPLTKLAEEIGMSFVQVSRMVNSLLEKGVLYEIVDAQTLRKYGRPTSVRPLFFNPELIFAGDKLQVDLTLVSLHILNDRIERQGIHLPYKIWISPSGKGRLYKRSTYLKKRREWTKRVSQSAIFPGVQNPQNQK